MPLSNASRLADFGTGIGTAGAIIQVDNANQRLGVGTTAPTATLGVAGIVSATAFYGDGSNLDGVASAGLGTALSDVEFDPLTVIYQTSDILSVGATITVDPPNATSKVAYTQYAEVKLENGADLIVADGDDFIPDILGLSTEGAGGGAAYGNNVFNTVYADNIEKVDGRGAPNFPKGINVVGVLTAASGSFSGNISIGGTLTYEDVTNIDSIGIITARDDINIVTDNKKLNIGASADLQLWHDGSNSYIKDAGTGDLKIQGASDVVIEDTSGANSAVFNTDAGVELYWRGGTGAGKKVETTSGGLKVTGNYTENIVAVSGTAVDCATGSYFTKTITGATTFTFTNVPAGVAYAFTFEVTLNGSNAITWPASVKWPADTAPTITDGKTQVFVFLTDDGGTRWRGSSLVDYTN